MRTGDPLSDSTQGTIGFAVKIEAAFGRGDDMGPALSFAHQPRSGAHLGAVLRGDAAGLGEGFGQGPETPPRRTA